jgi:hypothetical protein
MQVRCAVVALQAGICCVEVTLLCVAAGRKSLISARMSTEFTGTVFAALLAVVRVVSVGGV